MKNSMVLFELLLSIVIFAIVGVYSMTFLTKIQTQYKTNYEQNLLKLQLYSANNILQNRKLDGLNTNLILKDKTLYLDNKIFLNNVSKFIKNDILTICLGEDSLICQKVDLRL